MANFYLDICLSDIPKEERNDGEGPAFIGRAQEKNFDRDRAQQPAPVADDDPNDDLHFD